MVKEKAKQIKLLFFGYPSKSVNYTGGLLWMKKVADNIEKNNRYWIIKIYKQHIIRNRHLKIVDSIYDIIKALTNNPHIAFLDAWGESNIVLWLLLRILKPKTKIFIVFHHHEPRIIFCKNVFESIYNHIIQKFIILMLRNSDTILTVSQTSKQQLISIYGIEENKTNNLKLKSVDKKEIVAEDLDKKIAIVGTGTDKNFFKENETIKTKKDIDFLCIGRIEKFHGLEKIWLTIKTQRPKSNLVIVGRATKEHIARLRKIGIDHRGFVSEEEKINLYSKSKVFIFPSSREGFGIALAEAIYANLHIVAWKIPVFEELYLNKNNAKVKLIEFENYDLFVEECLKAVGQQEEEEEGKDKILDKSNKKIFFYLPTWQTVAKNVMMAIESINIQ
jgi:glycosyltransferase involved in cell wall biosynthesis